MAQLTNIQVKMAPSDEMLSLDIDLHLSNAKFSCLFEEKDRVFQSEFLSMEYSPKLIDLAELSNIVYSDLFKIIAPDKLSLPEGWRVLTAAQNEKNGYFGAAFWHRANHHVVIAHRGTSNIEAIKTDIVSIMGNTFTPQMNSACTFASMVLEALKDEKVHFTFTGHSLGAWLAQVTTFITEYLVIDEEGFRRRREGEKSFHPHTVVFDSPGCLDMLRKVSHTYFHRYDVVLADEKINDLDITSYLSPPNLVNTCGQHVGRILRIFPEISRAKKKKYFEKFILTFETHPMLKILETVNRHSNKTVEMLDWPMVKYSDGFTKSGNRVILLVKTFKEYFWKSDQSEVEKIYIKGSRDIEFHLEDESNGREIALHYKSGEVNITTTKINVFTKSEQDFLSNLKTFLFHDIKLKCYEEFPLSEDVKKMVNGWKFHYEANNIKSTTEIMGLINWTKQHFLWLPNVNKLMIEQVKGTSGIGVEMYRWKTEEYVSTFTQERVKFKEITDLTTFLNSAERALVFHVNTADDANCFWPQMYCYSSLPGMGESCSFFTYSDLQRINRQGIDVVKKFRGNESSVDNILVIDFCHNIVGINEMDLELLKSLVKVTPQENPAKKLVVLTNDERQAKELVQMLEVNKLMVEAPVWLDLETCSENFLLDKIMTYKGTETSLKEFISENFGENDPKWKSLIDSATLFKLIRDEKIIVGKQTQSKADLLDAYSDTCIDVVDDVCNIIEASKEQLFVITGASTITDDRKQKLKTQNSCTVIKEENIQLQDFKNICREEISKKENTYGMIHWLEALPDNKARWLQVYDGHFYFKRSFVQCKKVVLKPEALADTETEDVFVICGVDDEKTLLCKLKVKPESVMEKQLKDNITNGRILMEENKEKAKTEFERKRNKNTVHLLAFEVPDQLVWQESKGSLQSIRDYTMESSTMKEVLTEDEIVNQTERVVIIADNPGTGKTTTLRWLSHSISGIEGSWVISIDLCNCLQVLEKPSSNPISDLMSMVGSEEGISSEFAKNVLKYCLTLQNKVYLIFDGFDEIRQYHERTSDTVLKLFKYLKERTCVNMWISTRKYKQELLEDTLYLFATSFKEIGVEEQKRYLEHFWQVKLTFSGLTFTDKNEKIEVFVEEVLKTSSNFGSKITTLLSIPLIMRLLAVALLKNLEKYIEGGDLGYLEFERISDLYQQFMLATFNIYFREKNALPTSVEETHKSWLIEILTTKHRKLAFQLLCSQDNIESNFYGHALSEGEKNELLRVGLILSYQSEKPEFFHLTIAEFLTAEEILSWFKGNQFHQVIHRERERFPQYLLENVFLEPEFKMVRWFLDDLLANYDQQDNNLWCNPPSSYPKGNDNQTALHILAEENLPKLLSFLLRGDPKSKDLDAQDKSSSSPLHWAAKYKSVDVVRVLLSKEANVNVEDNEKRTPLHIAISVPNIKIVSMLLQAHASPYVRNESGHSPLCIAAEMGHIEMVKMCLLSKDYGNFCFWDDCVNKPIILAALKGNTGIVKILLNTYKITEVRIAHLDKILCIATWQVNTEMVQMLLEAGANPNTKDDGNPLICYAAGRGNTEIVGMLLGARADPNVKGVLGDSPLIKAVEWPHPEIVRMLLGAKADPNVRDAHGHTALVIATRKGLTEIVKMLLEARAVPDVKNCGGRTSLFIAAEMAHNEIVEMLLKAGASPNVRTDDEISPLGIALRMGNSEVIRMLEGFGGVP